MSAPAFLPDCYVSTREQTAETARCSFERAQMVELLSRLHPAVLKMLLEPSHEGHRFHWDVRCMTCAPQNARERRESAETLAELAAGEKGAGDE